MMLQSPTGPSSWMRASPLEVLINRACDPSLHEPNYALNLEVAEYINNKKANCPRDAAMCIARLANHRNPHVAILALALLDTLVQSCGYPMHLQISTKEFLNELVRRFPERPPPFPGPVMSRILELISGWKEGICTESRWKEDLGNIRDMHRLLTFKGYRFRDIPRQPSLSVASNLKTAEELEEEDREAQAAKLQELIRRGTPRDLAAAQELMKSLSGANPEAKPDYRSQALTELNKLEQKVILLNEMLDNVDAQRGERFVTGDAYDQVSSILKAARPKLQKWISDAESDDPESLDTFLQINDQINAVVGRYEAFKKGDFTAVANPVGNQDGSASQSSAQGVSLIDFDDSPSTSAPSAPSAPQGGLNDLSGLFSAPARPVTNTTVHAANGSVSQFPFMPSVHAPVPSLHQASRPPMGPGGFGMSPPQQSMTPPSIALPVSQRSTPVPSQLQSTFTPGYFNVGQGIPTPMVPQGVPGIPGSARTGGAPLYAQSPPQQQPAAQRPSPAQPANQQAKDPFADLAGLF